jgi:hypothetical protein
MRTSTTDSQFIHTNSDYYSGKSLLMRAVTIKTYAKKQITNSYEKPTPYHHFPFGSLVFLCAKWLRYNNFRPTAQRWQWAGGCFVFCNMLKYRSLT